MSARQPFMCGQQHIALAHQYLAFFLKETRSQDDDDCKSHYCWLNSIGLACTHLHMIRTGQRRRIYTHIDKSVAPNAYLNHIGLGGNRNDIIMAGYSVLTGCWTNLYHSGRQHICVAVVVVVCTCITHLYIDRRAAHMDWWDHTDLSQIKFVYSSSQIYILYTIDCDEALMGPDGSTACTILKYTDTWIWHWHRPPRRHTYTQTHLHTIDFYITGHWVVPRLLMR